MTTRNIELLSGEPLSVGLASTGSVTVADNGLLPEDWVEVGSSGHLIPGTHFTVGADATETAINLSAAMNRTAAEIKATASAGVISIEARLPGTAGDSIILGAYSAKYTLSGANLTGGTDVAGTAFVLDTAVALTLSGTKLLSVKNNAVEKASIDKDGNAVVAELQIKVYSQDGEPTLSADNFVAIWIDTDDSNKVYLVFRRGSGDQVKVQLS